MSALDSFIGLCVATILVLILLAVVESGLIVPLLLVLGLAMLAGDD